MQSLSVFFDIGKFADVKKCEKMLMSGELKGIVV